MSELFGKKYRNEGLGQLKNDSTSFDMVIIGGGITGAGILLDAVSRGMKVVLVEKNDFASGTSSRSTKLIHGGLRYLKQFEFKIVRDTGRERAIAYKNAPHLVVPEKMILPIVEGGTYGKLATSFGLYVYDRMAGVPKSERRIMKSKEETVKLLPQIDTNRLLGSGFYSEYRTDDARLTISVIKSAVERGAKAYNYVSCLDFIYEANGKVSGVQLRDNLTQETFLVQAKYVVNAAGPWSDELRTINKSDMSKKLHLTKGVHIVVAKNKFPLEHSVYFDVSDKRMIFAIPRGEIVYIGTTDTNYIGEKEEPNITNEDVLYLLKAVNDMFPSIHLSKNEIESSWSGLRPLIHQEGKAPSNLSRKDEVFISASGLITITGGKLTGYRLMAKKIVDLVGKQMGNKQMCSTDAIKISGYSGAFASISMLEKELTNRLNSLNLTHISVGYLVNNYGEEGLKVLDLYNSNENKLFEEAEADYILQYESSLKLLDFYVRRTGKMFFGIHTIKPSLQVVADKFADYWDWTDEKKQLEIQTVLDEIKARTNFVTVS
jgi:glycerol-3-phosphate dehydrogenase